MSYIRLPLKNILNINRVITIYEYHFAPDYFYRDTPHDFWELVYVTEGELDLEGDGLTHRMHAGEMIFHKPNENHSVKGDGIHESSVFIISFECHSPAMKFFNGKVTSMTDDLLGIMQLFLEECHNSFYISTKPLRRKEKQPVGSLQLLHNYLECILIRMMRNNTQNTPTHFFRSRKSLEDNLVRDIKSYLKKNLYNTITLEDLSREFHFGVSTLCNIFKKNTGTTIMHTFLEFKIDEAKQLLALDEKSISEIADVLGFDTPQYFSRMFNRYTGQSPRQYRNLVFSADPPRQYLPKNRNKKNS